MVRSAALAALKTLLDSAEGGAALPPEDRAAVQGRLRAMGASERSVAVSAQVRWTCTGTSGRGSS